MFVFELLVSLLPVILFLLALVTIDSFKLVPMKILGSAILAGTIAAAAAIVINSVFLDQSLTSAAMYTRYMAPLVEECCKSAYLILLIWKRRTGFMVDAAIYGFAIGAGFAVVENLYYLNALENVGTPLVWIVRGLGTAIMHGGTTAIVGILLQTASERNNGMTLAGLALAIGSGTIVHSAFNHFFLPPVIMTLLLLTAYPLLFFIVFTISERSLRQWLGVGFDANVEILESLRDGEFRNSNIGHYLQTIKDKFPGEVVADMLCVIQLRAELSLKAKAVLLLQEAGFTPEIDTEVTAKFDELHYVEKSIGQIGMLTLQPFLSADQRSLWELNLLRGSLGPSQKSAIVSK